MSAEKEYLKQALKEVAEKKFANIFRKALSKALDDNNIEIINTLNKEK